jgi:hypothetical protein
MGEQNVAPAEISEVIKLLRLPGLVTSVAFGPYDNCYLLMGTNVGQLLVLEPLSFNRITC